MENNKKLSGAMLVVCLCSPGITHALESDGYLRSGISGGTSGAAQSCFKLTGALSKYRFGNECEQYAEVGLRQTLHTLDDNSTLDVYGMAGFYNPYDRKPTFNESSDGWVRLPQIYAEWNNASLLNGGSLWVGRRYYNRKDIHISDFVYWNQSATGFGLDRVKIGDLFYSYVYSRKDSLWQTKAITRQDFNIAGFQTNSGGEVEVGVNYVSKPDTIENSHSGWSASVQHVQKIASAGKNKLAFQYGQGPGTGLGLTGDPTLDSQATSYRVVEALEWQLTHNFGVQFESLYQKDRRANQGDQNWLSLGIRPTYGITEHFKLVTDLGYDQIQADAGTRKLSKFTIAPTWSPMGPALGARPEVRLYYTYARWNKAAQVAADEMSQGSALSSTGPYGGALNGSNYGLQVEYWW